jgi:hypothetical protein
MHTIDLTTAASEDADVCPSSKMAILFADHKPVATLNGISFARVIHRSGKDYEYVGTTDGQAIYREKG